VKSYGKEVTVPAVLIVVGSIVVWLACVRPAAEAYRLVAKIFRFKRENVDDDAMMLGWTWPVGIPLYMVFGGFIALVLLLIWSFNKIFAGLHRLFFKGWRPARNQSDRSQRSYL
jgi:hypothetical protein